MYERHTFGTQIIASKMSRQCRKWTFSFENYLFSSIESKIEQEISQRFFGPSIFIRRASMCGSSNCTHTHTNVHNHTMVVWTRKSFSKSKMSANGYSSHWTKRPLAAHHFCRGPMHGCRGPTMHTAQRNEWKTARRSHCGENTVFQNHFIVVVNFACDYRRSTQNLEMSTKFIQGKSRRSISAKLKCL